MKANICVLFLTILVLIISCKKDKDVDTEKPIIDLYFQDAFPANCDTFYFGETFTLRLKFSDNSELGSYSIDIHNNFDHHSHSTEVTECNLDSVKDPINPYVFIDEFLIPSDISDYETDLEFSIPLKSGSLLFDEGDYHFFISLTDAEGWSTQKGLSIKMLYP